MDVGQLWVGFLDFFAGWDDEDAVVSIRQSSALTKSEKEWSSPFPCIAIEDPFDLSRNLEPDSLKRVSLFHINLTPHNLYLYLLHQGNLH